MILFPKERMRKCTGLLEPPPAYRVSASKIRERQRLGGPRQQIKAIKKKEQTYRNDGADDTQPSRRTRR
jgi:hypothetical protein